MTISAKIIADSRGTFAPRLTTLQLRYPKFIHGEAMTHRVFSRNASSSRAIPVERLIQDVINDPVYPSHWGANQKGMSADAECNGKVLARILDNGIAYEQSREQAWDEAREIAIEYARAFATAGYHKQIVNRLLEPFCHINVVVSSTQWSNFFALRRHPAAQPEMRILADAIYEAMSCSVPVYLEPDEWHTPYVTREEDLPLFEKDMLLQRISASVARCARVSYLTQEGTKPNLTEDIALAERLLKAQPLHASPAEHQATPSDNWKGPSLGANFGEHWVQYRHTLVGESQ